MSTDDYLYAEAMGLITYVPYGPDPPPDPRSDYQRDRDSLIAAIDRLSEEYCSECGGEVGEAAWGICAGCQMGMRND